MHDCSDSQHLALQKLQKRALQTESDVPDPVILLAPCIFVSLGWNHQLHSCPIFVVYFSKGADGEARKIRLLLTKPLLPTVQCPTVTPGYF